MGRKPRAGESPLSKLRVKAGMTQKQLAEKVGCSVSLIQKLESGKRNIRATNMLLELAQILKADDRFATFIGFRDDMVKYYWAKYNWKKYYEK